MPEWPSTTIAETDRLEVELSAANSQIEFMSESMADLELALEDRGWLALSIQAAQEFTRAGRRRASGLTRILSIQNPLIKRGIAIRTGYIWGQGVSIQARDEDVNTVVQAFLDDNVSSFSGSQAKEELERSLATDGNVYLAAFTSPLFGRVQIRSFNPDEVEEIISNPEDRDEPWFYLRQYVTDIVEAGYSTTRTRRETRRILYPALGFRPLVRPKAIDGVPVMWDAPVLHISVNRVDGWEFGIGDAYAAISWARAYKEFLEDWAKLTKSLSRYAWRVTASTRGRAGKAAIEAQRAARVGRPNESVAGGTAVQSGNSLEAVPKTGATIDSESGRPLAGMVAAALGVPVTMLLADPGQTGARAVAETLDQPTILEMTMRRNNWSDQMKRLIDYVIDQSVKAPRGALKGTIGRDEFGREIITLAGDVERSIDIDWPSLEKTDLKVLMDAIVAADGTNKIPPLTIVREILMALGVENPDEVLDEVADENGNFVDPTLTAGQVAVDAFNQGKTPPITAK